MSNISNIRHEQNMQIVWTSPSLIGVEHPEIICIAEHHSQRKQIQEGLVNRLGDILDPQNILFLGESIDEEKEIKEYAEFVASPIKCKGWDLNAPKELEQLLEDKVYIQNLVKLINEKDEYTYGFTLNKLFAKLSEYFPNDEINRDSVQKFIDLFIDMVNKKNDEYVIKSFKDRNNNLIKIFKSSEKCAKLMIGSGGFNHFLKRESFFDQLETNNELSLEPMYDYLKTKKAIIISLKNFI